MISILSEFGAQVERTLAMLGGKRELYEKLVLKFCDLYAGLKLSADFELSDLEQVKKDVHMLKGTAGNLGITPLYKGYESAMELLRAEKINEARSVLADTISRNNELLGLIKECRHGQEGNDSDSR